MKKYLFLAAMALAVTFTACNSGSSNKTESAEANQIEAVTQENHEHAMLAVQGSCDMCKETIEKTAKSVEGVASATWDLDSKELDLDFDPQQTTVAAVSTLIAQAGYTTDMDEADVAAYELLPGCCKYKEIN